MEKQKMLCFRCKKEIKIKENYYSFTEWINEKAIRTDYAHRICWDNFLKQISDTTEAMGIVRNLKNSLTRMGVLEPEEVVIT